MATAKKATAKKTTHAKRPVAKGPHKAAKKAPTKAKVSKKAEAADAEDEEDLEWMEVKRPAKKVVKKFPKLDLKPIKVAAKTVGKGKKARKIKPKKLSASQVLNHVVETTGIARKDVKLVLDTLADTIKAAVMPGSVGGAVIPGIGAVVRKVVKARTLPAIKKGTVVEKRPAPGQKGPVVKMLHPGRAAVKKPATVKARFILAGSTRRSVFGTI